MTRNVREMYGISGRAFDVLALVDFLTLTATKVPMYVIGRGCDRAGSGCLLVVRDTAWPYAEIVIGTIISYTSSDIHIW